MLNGIYSILCIGLFAVMSLTLLQLPADTLRLAGEVEAQLEASGVSNPVTAVLLNFRGYDTLLEVGVLLLALTGAWAVGREQELPAQSEDSPYLILLRLFVPPIILGSAYYLWVGAAAPGGAFQGGAVLAGALILLLLAGKGAWFSIPWLHRCLLAGGVAVFLTLAILPLFSGAAMLEYPLGQAKHWILIIESAALLSIAFTLTALFLGGPPKKLLPC